MGIAILLYAGITIFIFLFVAACLFYARIWQWIFAKMERHNERMTKRSKR